MTHSATTPACERHVVLVAPEIHWNTGNIGRTCLAVGARLHLIEPLGFSLDDRHLKRAGLDYWPQVTVHRWPDVDAFLRALSPAPDETAVFTKTGAHSLWLLPRPRRLFLVFGSETRGLPPEVAARLGGGTYHIPINARVRSLNLSTAVGIALYESLRGCPPAHAWPPARH